LIKSEKTKQLLANRILKVLEQHGGLTCFELTYRMKFFKGGATIHYDRRRIVRYLLLLKNLGKVEFDKTTRIWSLKTA
jgi:hypothetical protein